MVEYDIADGIATIALNRPKSLNAMTPELMGELKQTVLDAEGDPSVRALIITGRGRAFSSGGDKQFLNELLGMRPQQIKSTVYANFQGAIKAVKLCAKPTIAAVNGGAVGAGCELTLACDFRVAADNAYFLESWVHLGIIAPLGGMSLLPQLIGLGRATEMLMLGERVTAARAQEIGLVRNVVAAECLDEETRTLAKTLAAGPPLAYAAFKQGLRRGAESNLSAEWEANLHVQALLIDSADFREAVVALGEKRAPTFDGR